MTLAEKLTERMDTASGLYQMFNSLCDLVVLPARDKDGQITSSKSTADYMEEVPLDLVPQFVKDKGREYIVRACANIHCIHCCARNVQTAPRSLTVTHHEFMWPHVY